MKSIHSHSTDNGYLSDKISIRKEAVSQLGRVHVLDLFAGTRAIWDNIHTDAYTGVDSKAGKHPNNIVVDNRRLIPRINLSKYNVIDLDTYGVPSQQIDLLLANKTFDIYNTVIVYTMTDSVTSAQNKNILREFGLEDMYGKAPFLFNHYTADLFHAFLYTRGVRTIHRINKPWRAHRVEYGYFFFGEKG